MNWYTYSLFSAVFFSAHFLLVKKAGTENISTNLLILYMCAISGILMLGYQIFAKQSLNLSKSAIYLILFISIFWIFGAYFLTKAIYLSPNAGYATAIGSLQVLIVVIASIFIFDSDFSYIKLIGAILVILGVILLGL